MSQENLSKQISDILKADSQVNFSSKEEKKPISKKVIHEEVDLILKSKAFNKSLEEDLDLSEQSFNRINNSILKEYVENLGFCYTTRKQSIQLLFETNKINQKTLFLLEDKQIIDGNENVVNNVLDEFEDAIADEFETKYGEDIDFRDIEQNLTIDSNSPVYEKLNSMERVDWINYVNILKDNKINCYFDPNSDCFFVTKIAKDGDVERFSIEKEDHRLIENIVNKTNFKLIETRGLPKHTGKQYVIEAVVEKNGYKTIVEYHDTQLRKPWKVASAEFQFLQEALESITIPYKALHKEQVTVVKKPSLLNEIAKANFNKTDNLPLCESQRRERNSKSLIAKMDTLHNSDAIIEILKEGIKVNTSKGNGTVRYINWLDGSINIDCNNQGNFISNISFDDIKGFE